MHRYDERVRSMFFQTILYASALSLLGCGSGFAPYILPTFAGGTPPYAYYHAYGDSITFGATLKDPPTQAYPALVAKADGLTLTNLAIPSDQACDVPTRQIFPAQDSPTLSTAGLYSLLIGTNDFGIKGPGPYEPVFNLCHQAAISWLALPAEDKILSTSPTVLATGPVSVETANHWNALTTNGIGASITFPFTRSINGSVYIWYRIRDGSPGTFTYSLDGVQAGSAATATVPAIATLNGSNNSLALLRLPGVSAGQHKLILTQTSTGLAGLGVVAIGLPPMTAQTKLPLVLVGTISKTIGQDCPFCDIYTKDITDNVSKLAAEGLNVKDFTSGKYLSPADLNDTVHPNTAGQLDIAHAVLDVLN